MEKIWLATVMIQLFGSYLVIQFFGSFGQQIDELAVWQKLFQQKRVQQLAAVKSLQKLDQKKQEMMVQTMLQTMLKVMKDARVIVQESNYYPGMDFPKDEKAREAISQILENSALFAEIILRLPDLTERIYKKDNEMKMTIDWAINFSSSTNFLDEISKNLIHLASQELNLTPKEENFVNPYRISAMKKAQREKEKESEAQGPPEKKAKKKKEKNPRGPRLQSSRSGGDL